MFPFRHILVPLDGSELAEQALPPALAVAEAMSAQVVLLRVVPSFTVLTADPHVYEEMVRLGEDEARAYLRSVCEQLPATDLHVGIATEYGAPADAILRYAEEHHVDLIVMSSHGRSGVSRWVYGSVAEKVLRSACCATMIVRQQAAKID